MLLVVEIHLNQNVLLALELELKVKYSRVFRFILWYCVGNTYDGRAEYAVTGCHPMELQTVNGFQFLSLLFYNPLILLNFRTALFKGNEEPL